ncbi:MULTISPECIES: hypothetical protein [unclassified Microcoleus]|jgi:hypothetical protein|nr:MULTISPECIES: hypothetical protein [unclassified Microcoleus]
MKEGRWKKEEGRRKMEDGRWKMEGFSYRRKRTDSLQWFQQLRMF